MAEYLTLLFVIASSGTVAVVPYDSAAECGRALGADAAQYADHDLSAQCVRTNQVTRSPIPTPRPEGLVMGDAL